MALKAGRVGVLPSEVDSYGKIRGGSGGGSGGGLKLYYKDYSNWETNSITGSGFATINTSIYIEGYTPIHAMVLTNGTDSTHSLPVGVSLCVREGSSKNNTYLRLYASRGTEYSSGTLSTVNGVKDVIRVFYIKNENLEVLE